MNSYLPREPWSWVDPRGGQGCWQRSPVLRPILPSLALVVGLALGVTLWIALVVAGRSVMCSTHDNAMSYCHKQTEATR